MILLDITLTNGWAIVVVFAVALIIWTLVSNKFREQALNFQKKEAELKVTYQNWALAEFEKFKKSEIDKIRLDAEDQGRKAASVLLQKWKIENEAKIRQDAINRSYSVNLGKITEHLVPFHQKFLSQFNPKDARFIGSPIDLIVFDGYADKKNEIQIYLVEVKTGNSKLTEIQKKIKDAVLNGNIRWAEINPGNNAHALAITNEVPKIGLNHHSQLDLHDDYREIIINTVRAKEGETRNALIDRIADTIEAIATLIDDEGYTLESAIAKMIHDDKLTFKTEADREIFIDFLTENN